ncbi:hypothetical protein IWX92DRAFT_372321 [Phyllosticta citricarpa]
MKFMSRNANLTSTLRDSFPHPCPLSLPLLSHLGLFRSPPLAASEQCKLRLQRRQDPLASTDTSRLTHARGRRRPLVAVNLCVLLFALLELEHFKPFGATDACEHFRLRSQVPLDLGDEGTSVGVDRPLHLDAVPVLLLDTVCRGELSGLGHGVLVPREHRQLFPDAPFGMGNEHL